MLSLCREAEIPKMTDTGIHVGQYSQSPLLNLLILQMH